jgi:hypothetical protein
MIKNKLFRKNIRNTTWFTIWGEKILPGLSIENLIFYVLQISSLVLAVLMSNQNTKKQIIYIIL